jgi:magnesium chelatase family protein
MLDRIDIHVDVPRVENDKLLNLPQGESSAIIRGRIEKARAIQRARFNNHPKLFANADISVGQIDEFCPMTDDAKKLLAMTLNKFKLSARSYHRLVKISRTIADLEGVNMISAAHVGEAVHYRPRNT